MTYTVRIERDSRITLEEWERAVVSRPGVRLQQGGSSVTNPVTQEVITIGAARGDAEVSLDGQWVSCFRWRQSGRVAFEARSGFDHPGSPLRGIVRELANELNARVVGEGDEEYE